MAALGWAGSLSQGYTGQAPKRRPKPGIFRQDASVAQPTTMRAQAPTPITRRPLIVCCTTYPIALQKASPDLPRRDQQAPWIDQTRRTIPGEPFDLGKRENEWRVLERHASTSTLPAVCLYLRRLERGKPTASARSSRRQHEHAPAQRALA